jgi:hypothetical protein
MKIILNFKQWITDAFRYTTNIYDNLDVDYSEFYIVDIFIANPEIYIDIITAIFYYIVLLFGKERFFSIMLKNTDEEGLNEDNYEGDSNENNIEKNIPAGIDNSEDNDDNDDKDNYDEKDISKVDKGKRKATKEEEEEAWEIENRAEDTENGSNDDTEDEEDFNKQIQIKYDEDLAKRMQSEEYKGNLDNSYDSDSSYSVISSVFSENDSNERANKKLDVQEEEKKTTSWSFRKSRIG